jgi:hypothetical protein
MLGRGVWACAHELMFPLVSASCVHLMRNSSYRRADQRADLLRPSIVLVCRQEVGGFESP